MNKTAEFKFIFYILPICSACLIFCCSSIFSGSPGSKYNQQLIAPGSNPPMLDNVEIGNGRNDGVSRLYTPRNALNSSGYECTFSRGKWSFSNTFNTPSYCSSPVIADIKNEGRNTLYLGGWEDLGVVMLKFSNGWTQYKIFPGSAGKGNILAMLSGNGRNDGVNRLYVAHWSDSGLVEYSWTGSAFTARQLMNKSVGRFAIGKGRNDGINRIYAVERGGRDLHEFTWNGSIFTDRIIFTGNAVSNGAVYVADGRGDRINRIYAWAGGLFELTWESGKWTSLIIDKNNRERYYITAGSIRNDNQPGVYVSVKSKGLHEYIWSKFQNKFDVDVITGATGGCSIGDVRGDGKNRLYVARGTKGNYSSAAVVEIREEE